MKVVLSQDALECLNKIVSYYQRKGNGMYGRKVRARILKKTARLKDFPQMGPVEEILATVEMDYRYLVEGNYKIHIPDL